MFYILRLLGIVEVKFSFGGNNWELFEHIRFEILGKAKDEYKKKLIEFYVKEMRDTPLTKNRKKLA